MRILNLTHSPFWFDDHFKYLLAQTSHTGETLYRSEGAFDATKADAIWHELKDYFETFDAVLVSHVSSWSRVFLQNGWKKPLFVWFFFRFDHDVPDQQEYYNLLREAQNRPNVKFFAATEYDREYARMKLGDFPIDVIRPFTCVNNENKTRIPCDDRFYLLAKHNETLLNQVLTDHGVPFYQQKWEASVPDLRGVKAVIHFPYVYATRSLIENLAIENVYFLPTQKFLWHLRQTVPTYFWDGGLYGEAHGDFSLAEWYLDIHKDLMIYFESFEDLKNLTLSPRLNDMIAEKKQAIREFNARQHEVALTQWKELLK